MFLFRLDRVKLHAETTAGRNGFGSSIFQPADDMGTVSDQIQGELFCSSA